MKKYIFINNSLYLFLLYWLVTLCAMADQGKVTLNQYLDSLKKQHPFFKQELLNKKIEEQQQQRFLGDKDWIITGSQVYQYEENNSASLLTAEKQDNVYFNAGIERHFWSTGGSLALDYDYYKTDQQFPPPFNTLDEHGNGVKLSFNLPLLKNRGGVLSRLEYELQGYQIDLSEISSHETLENFLQQQGSIFIEWVFIDEQLRIANNRLTLAREELQRTQRKRDSRLAAEVDVLRAKDAVIAAEQNVSLIKSNWLAVQAELATLSNNHRLYQLTTSLALYQLGSVPNIQAALRKFRQNSRQLKNIDIQIARLQQLERGVDHQLKPELNFTVGAALSGQDESFNEATEIDQPQYSVGLNFRFLLGQRSAKADLSKTKLQISQLSLAKKNIARQLESELRSVLIRLSETKQVLELNKEQIRVAKLRTQAEIERHNQGRSELSFVIQSRDNEQNVQLAYASNAATFQKLWLRYQALTDTLFLSK